MERAGSIGAIMPNPMFRLGVTGTARIADDATEAVRLQVRSALSAIKRAIAVCEVTLVAYRKGDEVEANLRLLSPLGEGADRLVAEEALQNDGDDRYAAELEVVLPFAQAQYEQTFCRESPDASERSVAEFRSLLAKAAGRVLELDGMAEPDLDRALSYEAAGRFVVRNCDLLIAIWDDQVVPRGRGGTSDTVNFALRAGVPVLWIHSSGAKPLRWLGDMLDLQPGSAQSEGDACLAKMAEHVRRVLVPPPAPRRKSRRRRKEFGHDPVRRYLLESDRPNRALWKVHGHFVRLLRHSPSRGAAPSSSFAAQLSAKYQERYRTSYLLVFAAGALAVIAAVTGLTFHALEPWAVSIELICLALIGALLSANRLERWHERYVDYRMLGELLRLHGTLDILGRVSPGTRIYHAAAGAEHGWVAWFFAACARTRPIPIGSFSPQRLSEARQRVRKDLIASQLAFHGSRLVECEAAARRLGWIGFLLFLATCVAVLVKLALLTTGADEALIRYAGFAVALLPGASAAVFGIRAYEEFEPLAEQSSQILEDLKRLDTRLESIEIDGVAASQALAAEFRAIGNLLLSDTVGWAQIFRPKAVEA